MLAMASGYHVIMKDDSDNGRDEGNGDGNGDGNGSLLACFKKLLTFNKIS